MKCLEISVAAFLGQSVKEVRPPATCAEERLVGRTSRLFKVALEQLGVTAAETLMVGDRASRDGGAAAVGITTLILPPVANYTPRGLDIVLHLLQCA